MLFFRNAFAIYCKDPIKISSTYFLVVHSQIRMDPRMQSWNLLPSMFPACNIWQSSEIYFLVNFLIRSCVSHNPTSNYQPHTNSLWTWLSTSLFWTASTLFMSFVSSRHLGLILTLLCSNLGLSRPIDGLTQVHAQWAIALQTSAPNVFASRPWLRNPMKASYQASSSAHYVGGNRSTIFLMALSGVRENLQPREGRGELGWFLLCQNCPNKVESSKRLGSQVRTIWIYLS